MPGCTVSSLRNDKSFFLRGVSVLRRHGDNLDEQVAWDKSPAGVVSMNPTISSKVALVTGASRGIGLAIARRLAEEGMALAVAARDEAKLRGLGAEVEARGGQALVHAADLSQAAAPAAFVAAAVERFGRIDLVVNNAGAAKRGDFLVLTEQDWSAGFGLKFFGAVRLCRAAWPHLVASRGCVVNIAGLGGRTGNAEFTIGGSVNAALLNLTKCLADRGVRDGIRVNAINPGSIRTDNLTGRIRRLAEEKNIPEEEAARQMTERMGIARFGNPGEIAEVVVFLASERAAFVQGAVLDVDGGQTRTL
jgi:NAD(P)-dependent dehydrogenase (short-subunit alcohol dehydrogenase family)